MTGYSSGLRNKRITIQNRKEAVVGTYGLDSAGIEWEDVATVWADVSWAKGMRTLNAGAIDAYGVVLVRIDYNDDVDMRSRIKWDGNVYQILPETFHPDKQSNTIQFNAQVIVAPGETDADPTPTPRPTPDPSRKGGEKGEGDGGVIVTFGG